MCNEAISGSRFLATARRFAPRCFYTAIARRALRFATCRTFSWHGEHLSVHKLGWWVWVAPDAQMDADEERDRQTHAVIGAAMRVHSELGHGFLEPVYQEALEREFVEQAIPYEREHALPILYRSRPLITTYRVDFGFIRKVLA